MGSSSDAKVRCEHCNRAYAWQEKYAGKKVRCKCGEVLRFPATPPGSDELELELELNLDSGIDLNLGSSSAAPGDSSSMSTSDGKLNVSPPANMGGPTCPSCHATVRPGAVICVGCGYHFKEGRKINTNVSAPMTGGGMVYDQPADGIFGKIKRSWIFAKISYGMIWDFKQLVLFPIFSGIAALLVLISFLVPLVMMHMNDQANTQTPAAVVTTADTTITRQATATVPAVATDPATDGTSAVTAHPTRTLTAQDQASLDSTRKGLESDGLMAKEQVDKTMTNKKASMLIPTPTNQYGSDNSDWRKKPMAPVDYLILFAFYFCNYFVIVFFNTALIACAIKITIGEAPTIGYGLKVAVKRLPQILAWAFVSALVGVVLKVIENSSDKLGKIIAFLLGTGWTILTFFVVPVIAVEGVGPIKAVGRSAKTLKNAWGEAAVGNFSMGLLTFLVALPIYLVMFAVSVLIMKSMPSLTTAVILFVVFLFVTIIITAASSAADTVFKALLYNFASGRALPQGVDTEAISSAFAMSRKGAIAGD